ncbi:hypothetical protein B0H10DRAFT_1110294 [Mycena sp. CBHHK59/15]|nr:hypothetical protein B0H10DRAFT_1110294 [Mycena sp. CBHHK59/15]
MNAPKAGLVTPPVGPLQVQESRTQRLERQQARFRDRGGIFVPRAHNNLLDILLGRKKPSPIKRRSRSRSLSCSPTKKPQKTGRGSKVAKAPRKISKKAAERLREEKPTAGPSRLPETSKKSSTKAATSRKGKKADHGETKPVAKLKGRTAKSKQTIEDEGPPESKTVAKRKSRPTKSKRTIDEPPESTESSAKPPSRRKPTKIAASEEPAVTDDTDHESRAAPSKKPTAAVKPRKKKALNDADAEDASPKAKKVKALEDNPADVSSRPQRARAAKSRQAYAELSDEEEEPDEQPKPARSMKAVPIDASKGKSKQRALDPAPAVKRRTTKAKMAEVGAESAPASKSQSKIHALKRALESGRPGDDDDRRHAPEALSKPKPKPRAKREHLNLIYLTTIALNHSRSPA